MIKKMMVVLMILAFACAPLLMASCAKKQIRTDEGAKTVGPAKEPPKEPVARAAEPEKESEAERLARLRELERKRKIRTEIWQFESKNIYFDFDKSELKPESRAILAKKAEWLRRNQEYSVQGALTWIIRRPLNRDSQPAS